MDNSANLTLFLEFYGLPGCGKSTISHAVARLLREKGVSVEEPSYDIDHLAPKFLRRVVKLLTTILWFVIHHNSFCEIYSIVLANNYHGLSKIEQISNIIQKIRIYKRKNSSHIVMWDQGLVQAAISLSINGYKSSDENLKRLYKLVSTDRRIIHILIVVDSETVINRMARRKTNDSRVEKLKNKDEIDRMLQSFIEGISNIEREFEGEKYDGKKDVEILSNLVLQKIINNLKGLMAC